MKKDLRICIPLKSSDSIETFYKTCEIVKNAYSEKTARVIIDFAAAVATIAAKPYLRSAAFIAAIQTINRYIADVKEKNIAEGGNADEWGFNLCYDVDKQEFRYGNCVQNGIVVFLSENCL